MKTESPLTPTLSPDGGEGGNSAALCRVAATTRLPVHLVEHLHRVVGGDARGEAMFLQFIQDEYGANGLLHLPPDVALDIIKRPADFIRAAKQHCEPELRF